MEIYTVGQAAEKLSVSDYMLRQLLRNGTIKGSKIGNAKESKPGKLWRITDEQISEYLRSCEQHHTK